ncbi:unnamed protein product, partial [Mesorhabditis belari]|uniref:Uncharacterized protein n=1 Tax=Mesorhabditis belari TaxID=2138241 RepID=A0AAF3FD16_9BILA
MDRPETSGEYETDELMRLMKCNDFILESQAEEVVESCLNKKLFFIKSAAESLSQNYKGSSHLCNLIFDWFNAIGLDPTETKEENTSNEEKATEEEKETPTTSKKRKKNVTKKEKEASPKKEIQKSPTFNTISTYVEDTLATMLKKEFQPDCADSIFGELGGGIEWLPELISCKIWREMIYTLIESHPQCLMLNFAVKLISDAGYQTEIANVNTATQQLEIFTRIFLTSIDSLLSEYRNGEHTAQYETQLAELVRIVCQSEHTYLYTAALLEVLSREVNGIDSAACHHILQTLRSTLKGHEQETTAFRCAMLHTAEDQVASHVVQALLTMTSKQELNPADISHIYQQYILPHPPPAEVIRDPLFIEMLIDSLFHCDGSKVNMEHREKYIYLLAYASSVFESYKNKRRNQTRVELDVTRSAIERATSLIENLDEVLSELPDLLREARVPVVATGLLYFAETYLLSESRIGDLPVWPFVLIDQTASLHPNLHSTAFTLCTKLYEKVSKQPEAAEVIMERQRLLVDRFIHLFSIGFAIPVLEKIHKMYRDALIDSSLVRYFSIEVLEIVSPPYSKILSNLLIQLVSDEEIFEVSLREKHPIVSEFIAHYQSGQKN